jgi:3-oxoacyl-[acyl-carrier-protein] synthase-1
MKGSPLKVATVITGINCITPVGQNAEMTSASVKEGVGQLEYSEIFFDSENNSVKTACIEGFGQNDKETPVTFMNRVAKKCLTDFLDITFTDKGSDPPETICLLIGCATEMRPGMPFDILSLEEEVKNYTHEVITEYVRTGNPSAIHALEKASEIIQKSPETICIIGAIDSLLEPVTLEWFEKDQRLNAESIGRNQSFSPSQAVAFFSVESKQSAIKRNRTLLAEITGCYTAKEPSPFVSGLPSKGEGLTTSVRTVLTENTRKPFDPESIRHVFCDLNGEYYRAKEWGYAELRCFGNADNNRKLWHPADCMGNAGAASAGVLLTIAAEGLKKKWLEQNVLVFSSDDHGDCGAVILSDIG